MLYSILFESHIVVSGVTLLSGIAIVVSSFRGWFHKKEYSTFDIRLSLVFTLSLYLQLIIGLGIYFILRTNIEHPLLETESTTDNASLRFWAIEHIALNIFALFLTQVGRIYIKKSKLSMKRFKASLFYYGISLFLILFSLGVALFFR